MTHSDVACLELRGVVAHEATLSISSHLIISIISLYLYVRTYLYGGGCLGLSPPTR